MYVSRSHIRAGAAVGARSSIPYLLRHGRAGAAGRLDARHLLRVHSYSKCNIWVWCWSVHCAFPQCDYCDSGRDFAISTCLGGRSNVATSTASTKIDSDQAARRLIPSIPRIGQTEAPRHSNSHNKHANGPAISKTAQRRGGLKMRALNMAGGGTWQMANWGFS